MAVEEAEVESVPEKKPGGLKKILVITLLLLIAVGGSVAATLFIRGKQAGASGAEAAAATAEKPPPAKPLYLSIDPPLVVNFQNQDRVSYLQVGIDIMSRDQAVLDAVNANMPVVRNNLILLFSGQSYDTLSSREGKQKLRGDALHVVQSVVASSGSGDGSGVEQVYFTSFVMQ